MNEEIEMTGKAQQENEIKPAKQSILKIPYIPLEMREVNLIFGSELSIVQSLSKEANNYQIQQLYNIESKQAQERHSIF